VETVRWSTIFTLFEGTSEIQRMLIGRTLTELDVSGADRVGARQQAVA
jgi:alkylation response protein AidB-like acyl-CoA dehydrogenase